MNKSDLRKLKKKYGALKSSVLEIAMLLIISLFIFCLGGMAGFYDIEKIISPIASFLKNISIIALAMVILLVILWIIWDSIKTIKYKFMLSKLPLSNEEYLKLNILTPYDKIAFYKNVLKIFVCEDMRIFLSEPQENEVKLIIKNTFFELLEEEDIFIKDLAEEYNFNLNKVNIIFISKDERASLDEILYFSSLGIKFGIIKNLEDENLENENLENEAYLYIPIDML
jgi:hypothetical protein